MKEALFFTQNKAKWKLYEQELASVRQPSPDALADIYIDLTNDLSFAQTHYRHSHLVTYLNGLSTRFHQQIYRQKTERSTRFATYWTREVPLVLYEARRELMWSLLIFVAGVAIGIFSSAMNEDFKYSVLSFRYVQSTLDNIKNGDPMAVFKEHWAYGMFLGIALNNVLVMLRTFVMGIAASLGSALALVFNGAMLGVFHYLFYEHGLLGESLLTVWIHGSLEIPCIVVAGAAGITLGNGLLFPRSYRRIDSLMMAAKRGMKIMVGVAPIVVLAAVFESFLTRYTNIPDALRLGFILLMLAFVIFYFVIYPMHVHRMETALSDAAAT
ncbi:MAG: stage II sporulation protein M [Prevotellaceae bacterium]|nr:stage II sporulation protein M [Prevotellaceae bacterium]